MFAAALFITAKNGSKQDGFQKLMNKQTVVDRHNGRKEMRYRSTKKIGKNFNCMLLSKRSQYAKATYYVITNL